MSDRQADLFGAPAPPERPHYSDEFVSLIRGRLQATLDVVKAAEVMPWPDRIAVLQVENTFSANKDILPPEEGAAMWAEFDREIDRLFEATAAAEDAAEAAAAAQGMTSTPA